MIPKVLHLALFSFLQHTDVSPNYPHCLRGLVSRLKPQPWSVVSYCIVIKSCVLFSLLRLVDSSGLFTFDLISWNRSQGSGEQKLRKGIIFLLKDCDWALVYKAQQHKGSTSVLNHLVQLEIYFLTASEHEAHIPQSNINILNRAYMIPCVSSPYACPPTPLPWLDILLQHEWGGA